MKAPFFATAGLVIASLAVGTVLIRPADARQRAFQIVNGVPSDRSGRPLAGCQLVQGSPDDAGMAVLSWRCPFAVTSTAETVDGLDVDAGQ